MSDPLATVYPTGIRLIDELTEFMAQRLPGMFGPVPEGPSSLDEDWWIEDRLAEGHHFPLARMSQREGLRACYRWARSRAWLDGRYGHPSAAASLLLHQISGATPVMFLMAGITHAEADPRKEAA